MGKGDRGWFWCRDCGVALSEDECPEDGWGQHWCPHCQRQSQDRVVPLSVAKRYWEDEGRYIRMVAPKADFRILYAVCPCCDYEGFEYEINLIGDELTPFCPKCDTELWGHMEKRYMPEVTLGGRKRAG